MFVLFALILSFLFFSLFISPFVVFICICICIFVYLSPCSFSSLLVHSTICWLHPLFFYIPSIFHFSSSSLFPVLSLCSFFLLFLLLHLNYQDTFIRYPSLFISLINLSFIGMYHYYCFAFLIFPLFSVYANMSHPHLYINYQLSIV